MTNPTDPGAYSWTPSADMPFADYYDEINNQAALDEIDAYERDLQAGLIPTSLHSRQIPEKGTE